MTVLSWWGLLAVVTGASAGAVLRWLTFIWLDRSDSLILWGPLVVNCVGGLLVGAAMVALERSPHEAWRLLVVTGFLGSLTTFSAFSSESLMLILRGDWATALLHTLAHVAGALLCAALGYRLARLMLV